MDIFDTIKPKTEKRDIFDMVGVPSETQQDVPTPILSGLQTALKEKPEDGVFKGTGASGTWEGGYKEQSFGGADAGMSFPFKGTVPESPDVAGLGIRGLKSFANIMPETVKEVGYGIGGGKIVSFYTAYKVNKALEEQGITSPSLRQTQKRVKQKMLEGTKIPEFEIKPATTIGEKAVDIATGVGKFVTKLAVLKKAYPSASTGALWEMENLSSGGKPGMGYTMATVFGAPGKIIKSTSKVAQAGRLGLESAGLAGVTALEQKIDTGTVRWQDVAVSALIPPAMKLGGVARKKVGQLLTEPLNSKRITLAQAKKFTAEVAAKAKETGLSPEYIVGNIELRRDAPKIISAFPQKIRDQKSLEEIGKAIQKKLGLAHWDVEWVLDPKVTTKTGDIQFGQSTVRYATHTAKIHIAIPSGKRFPPSTVFKAGHGKKGIAKAHTQAFAKQTIIHELGHLINPSLSPKLGAVRGGVKITRKAHSIEFSKWVDDHVKVLFTTQPGKITPVSEVASKATRLMTFIEFLESKGLKKKRWSQDATSAEIMSTPEWKAEAEYTRLKKAGQLPTASIITSIPQTIKAAKPVTFETTNKAVEAQIAKAKIINITERKASLKALRKKQSVRYATKRRELELSGLTKKQAHKIAGKARGGKAAVPQMTPLELTPAQRAIYDRRIEKAYPLGPKSLTNANAMDVLTKLENGQIPTAYEFGLLEPVMGRETLTKVYKAVVSQKGLELWDIPTLARDIPKAIRFGFDPQAARGLSKMTIRQPLIYLSTLGKNIRGIFSKKYTNRVSTQIESSPIYKLGKKGYGTNYLSMRPWASVEAGTKLEQYGHVSEIFLRSNNKIIKGVGTWLQASERGANLGMNSALNKLVIKSEKDLARYGKSKNLSEANKAAWRKRRGHDINIYTKRITAKHPKGKAIQRAANWFVFSPAYTASGLVSGPNAFLKLATGKGFADKTYAMQIMLSRLAGLVAVSSGVGYVGYKYRLKNPTEEPAIDSSPNPVDSLFGKIRQGNEVYDLGFGDVAEYRLMARIGLSAHMAAKSAITGEQITTTVGGKKIPAAGEALGVFMDSKRTLILSLAKQLATGKDWMGRPVTLKDTALDNLPFEFLQAFVEAGEVDGLWEDIADGLELDNAKKALGNLAPAIAALGGVGTGSYPVHTSVTRRKFENIIAKEDYEKVWDELSPSEQRRLKSNYRKQFEVLNERIRAERAVDPPFSRERADKEKRQAKVRVVGKLSPKSRKLTKDIKLNIDRRPKDFYLNDKRYNKYQDLIAEIIDERLSKIDFSKTDDRRRVKRVQLIVKSAKNKAFTTLRREIHGK